MRENVTVFGAGYVGLVTGACLADSGFPVTMVDVDTDKLALLRDGKPPFFEPELEEILARGIAGDRLRFATPDEVGSLAGLAIVAVGTPSTEGGAADLRHVRAVVDRLAQVAEPGTVVVMKSTVPPGTGLRLAERLRARDVAYVSNPEFLREGSAVADWRETDRVVVGGDPDAMDRVGALYETVDAPVVRCDVTSAELIKYASNAFLATKISFINEIARLCDSLGADVERVAEGVGLDARIGTAFLGAGIGYGGSCFPKDARALDFLSNMHGYDFQLLRAVIEVNTRQRVLPVRALREHFRDLEGRTVAVLGLTFKPDTDDTREAPAREIIDLLVAEGATVRAYNPIPVQEEYPDAGVATSLEEAVAGCDAVVVATEWRGICEADWSVLVASMQVDAVVFDGRNCLDRDAVRSAGATYLGVGRGIWRPDD